ncbi:MAG: hypothetical protein E7208_09010 [Clostridium butyricum]|nr:hypothetical protein [Clostridium butyricum]
MNTKNAIKVDYIDELGFYTIEDYDKKHSFSSFLAGIAGVKGIPMWSFYVNRGQAISSIGIRDKDNCIMEFFPANEAYKMVYINGFRTFIKIETDKNEKIIEPFSVDRENNISRTLKIKNNELKLIEMNRKLNIKTTVTYFTIPNEKFSALGRKVEIVNESNATIKVEVLDGLTSVLPYGSKNIEYKEIGNTLRSWMQGEINENKTAIYKVRSSTGDSTKMDEINNGYFYLAFDKEEKPLDIIVDPEDIFGYDTSLKEPIEFYKKSVDKIREKNISYNKVPCAFTGSSKLLKANEGIEIYSYIGYMNSINELNESQNKLIDINYFENKTTENNEIIDGISKHVNTVSAYPLFDEYIKQCYIDNVLRGGYPLEIGDKVYYVYSRKHGDLERDYNFFSIEPNYYSQGNGNFRDVNQNRRMDIDIHPFTERENIKIFNELIQLDGYNPLVIKGKKFYIEDENKQEVLEIISKYNCNLEIIIEDKFSVGELYSELTKINGLKHEERESLLEKIIKIAKEETEADFGEGFWIDHWTYNLDLIEEYLNIYPDKIKDLLIDDKEYKFYNSPEYVLARKEKYELDNDKVRQYVCLGKKEPTKKWVYDEDGNLYKVNLYTKLLMLAGIKFMTLDNMGFGIEMEAGKPGWNDAMNGLPGLLGSSFAETAELKRLLLFIKENLDVIDEELELPVEFFYAINDVNKLLIANLKNDLDQFNYWDKVSTIRENYREKTMYTVSGKNKSINKYEIDDLVERMICKIDLGIEKIKRMSDGKIPTFMEYEVTEYEVNDKKEIKPIKFKVNFLPMFLEGVTRYLKTDLEDEEKLELYKTIKNSDVYDKKLKMYKTSESLEDVSFEIGRARTFTAGWLERESIFMHMEFKYILELIKNGLYEEFFEDIKNVIPPFMDPEVYGRSILENSSFIASSSNPDLKNHGRGFVARLSGTTVEMLNIWKIMMVGRNLFNYEEEILKFKLNPILIKDFFKDNILTTTLLGSIKLIYVNTNNKNTFGKNKGSIKEFQIIDLDDNVTVIVGDEVCGEYAEKIRRREIKEIRVTIL